MKSVACEPYRLSGTSSELLSANVFPLIVFLLKYQESCDILLHIPSLVPRMVLPNSSKRLSEPKRTTSDRIVGHLKKTFYQRCKDALFSLVR